MGTKVIAYKYQVSFLKLALRMSWYQGVAIMEFIVTLITKERMMHRLENKTYKGCEGGGSTYLSLFSLVEGGVELLESSQEPDVHSG
jgi:hypothetical protein